MFVICETLTLLIKTRDMSPFSSVETTTPDENKTVEVTRVKPGLASFE